MFGREVLGAVQRKACPDKVVWSNGKDVGQ